MKTQGGVDVCIHVSLNSAQAGGQRDIPAALFRGRTLDAALIRDLLNTGICFEDVKNRKFFNLSGLELEPVANGYNDCTGSYVTN
jgi:hypothetical protein